jgi:hypothetical protein
MKAMIEMIIGRDNLQFRFMNEIEPLDNLWAGWALDNKRLVKYSDKKYSKGVVGGKRFEIAGLDEEAMRKHVKACDILSMDFENTISPDTKEVFKGTTFGRSYNVFSAYAMLLKVGLPKNVKVRNHVLFTWTAKDLERYVVNIDEAIRRVG